MNIINTYQSRPIRFLEVYQHNDWQIKSKVFLFRMSLKKENIAIAKTYSSVDSAKWEQAYYNGTRNEWETNWTMLFKSIKE